MRIRALEPREAEPLERIMRLRSLLRVFAILLAILLAGEPARAVWISQNSGVTNTIQDIDFPVDASTGYAVGQDDANLSGSSYRSHDPFLELKFKFDEETLGRPATPPKKEVGPPPPGTPASSATKEG